MSCYNRNTNREICWRFSLWPPVMHQVPAAYRVSLSLLAFWYVVCFCLFSYLFTHSSSLLSFLTCPQVCWRMSDWPAPIRPRPSLDRSRIYKVSPKHKPQQIKSFGLSCHFFWSKFLNWESSYTVLYLIQVLLYAAFSLMVPKELLKELNWVAWIIKESFQTIFSTSEVL